MSKLVQRSVHLITRSSIQLRNTCQCSRVRLPNSRSISTGKAEAIKPFLNTGETLKIKQKRNAELAKEKKQFNRLAVAVAACLLITFSITQFVEIPEKKKILHADVPPPVDAKFQGKEVIVAAGGNKLVAHDDKTGQDIELVSTGASSVPHFPKTIKIPRKDGNLEYDGQNEDEYTLIGLGIRTVSFFRVQVYVVGLYVQTSSLQHFQSRFIKRVNKLATALIPGEKEELKKALLDGAESYEIWDTILKDTDNNINSAFRIVPTRSTDFRHMLDGWIRGITSRTQAATQNGDQQYSDESFASSIKSLMDVFAGKGKTPKGNVLILSRDGKGQLGVFYQDKTNKPDYFGHVEDERIARLIWLGYLGGKVVSSENARQSIVDGILDLVERPIGTAAAKVD